MLAHCDLPVVDVAVVPVVAAVVLVVDVAVVPAAAVVGSEAACCRDLALASSSSYTGSRTRCKATAIKPKKNIQHIKINCVKLGQTISTKLTQFYSSGKHISVLQEKNCVIHGLVLLPRNEKLSC